MNTQSAVRQQLAFWHGTLDQVLGDCGDEVLNWNPPDATITSIASIYAHIVFGEDAIVQGMLQGKPLLYQADGWEAKTSVPFPGLPPAIRPDWARAVQMNLAAFQPYAKTVYAAADSYLADLPDAELERKTGHFGDQTVGWIVANILGTHAPQHAGEIAALKGVQGLKGLPF